MRRLFAVLCMTLMFLCIAQTLAPPAVAQGGQLYYKVQDVGGLGGWGAFGTGINNQGWIEGVAAVADNSAWHAFLWRKGVMTDLGTLGGPNSGSGVYRMQWGPNERGQIATTSDTTTPDPYGNDICLYGTYLTCHAALWQDGVMTDLGTLGGNNSMATSINARGQIVGIAENNVPDSTCLPPQVLQMKPVIWDKGRIKELPTLPGDPDGWASGINNKGHIVGNSGICFISADSLWGAMARHAVIWRDGKVENLGSLGGMYWHYTFGINNSDQVVGYSHLPGDLVQHGFLWENGVMKDLGTLPGDLNSAGLAINDKGQIVGFSNDEAGNSRAVIWEGGQITDLNTLIDPDSTLILGWAEAINERGQITGWAFDSLTEQLHVFLATPALCPAGQACSAKQQHRSAKKAVAPAHMRELLRQRRLLSTP